MTQKIVINENHGGFGLSPTAFRLYQKIKFGRDVFSYKLSSKSLYVKSQDNNGIIHWSTLDKPTLTTKELNDNFVTDYDIQRDDPILIQIVEDLDIEANNKYSTLKIVEIPDDVEWMIEEYDGAEWISEKHRTWC